MRIFLKTLASDSESKTIVVEVNADVDTVGSIKDQVSQKLNIPKGVIKLIAGKYTLNDDDTINDVCRKNNLSLTDVSSLFKIRTIASPETHPANRPEKQQNTFFKLANNTTIEPVTKPVRERNCVIS